MPRKKRLNVEVLERHLKATQRTLANLRADRNVSDEEVATQRRAVDMARLQLKHYKKTGLIESGYVLFKQAEAESEEAA